MTLSTDFSGWKKYFCLDGVTVLGVQSPDGRESRLLIDREVAAWLLVPGNPTKLL